MSDTILVAVDGSPPAQAAALVAIQIAQCQKWPIRGLYVVDEHLVMDSYANYLTELGQAREPASRADLVNLFREQGDATLQWLEDRCQSASVPVTTDLMFGGIPDLVLQEATRAKLLAVGRRGRGHAADPSHLGRNFRTIAHHVCGSVLVGGDESRRVLRLLLAYNGDECAERALEWATLLQQRLADPAIALAVQEGSRESQQWLSQTQAHLDTSGLGNYRFESREGQPASEIVKAATEGQVDLIVMGRYCHTALLEWLVGSTPDHVLRQTQLPVLIA